MSSMLEGKETGDFVMLNPGAMQTIDIKDGSDTLGGVRVTLGPKVIIQERSVQTVLDFLGGFGGIFKLLASVFGGMRGFLLASFFKVHLVQEMLLRPQEANSKKDKERLQVFNLGLR